MEVTIEKIAALLQSDSPDHRRQGIILAARANAVNLSERLTAIAGSDPDQELRILARKALEKIRAGAAPEAGDDAYANRHFEELLQSEDPYARFAGLKKALQQNTEIARLCILSALEKEKVAQLKASMIMAAGRFAREEDIELISEFLRDGDSRVRANAIEALATIGGETANRYIISMMGDEDNRVKTNVVKALKGLGGPNLLELLRRMAQDERVWMRASAIFAFTRIKSPQSLVMLAQVAAQDPEEQIRRKALAAIRTEKDDGNPAAAVILEKLEKGIQTQQMAAAREIVQEMAPAATNADMRQMLFNPDPCRRYLALADIGSSFSENESLFVEAFQKETDAFLLSMMLTTIKEKKPAQTTHRCIQLLKHEDDRVRANAVEAAAAVEIASSAEYILPLLQDKNSRVAANAVMALGPIGRVDTLSEVKKLISRGREAFKQSAMYVISLQNEPQYVPVIESLLLDASPKVRDKAYQILRSYMNEKVPGAMKLLQDVEARISLEKSREHFFENSLDQMFSSLVQMIKADSKADDEFVFERTPEAERQSLIMLARKALENRMGDERTVSTIGKIELELEKIAQLLKNSSTDTGNAKIDDAARHMSEIQLLKLEQKSLKIRRDAILIAFALDVYRGRESHDSRTQAFLRVEMARVEGSLCNKVPEGAFSMLPPEGSSVSEIFDLTMRLYQKHVWIFSYETGCKFLKWFALFILAAFLLGIFQVASTPVAGLYVILALPYFSYKSLQIFVEWKTLITCMVDDFIHGRNDRAEWPGRVNTLYPRVFSNALRKYFYLLAWFIVAILISGVFVSAGKTFIDLPMVASFSKLLGLLMMIAIVASVYFKFMLVEPVSVLDADADAFETAEKIYLKDRVRFATLVIFATFIMALITGTSMQVVSFLLPVLPGKASAVLTSLLALVSEVCLFPIVYSSVVIYTLMFFRYKSCK